MEADYTEIRKPRYLATFQIECNCHLPDVPVQGMSIPVPGTCTWYYSTVQVHMHMHSG